MEQTTVGAISTPYGKGGVALIRITGPQAVKTALQVFTAAQKPADWRPKHATATYGHIVDTDGKGLDDGLLTVFYAPFSYTGEDVAEISCHGGPYGTKAVLEAVFAAGAIPAGPGEFTRRAFINGKLDLTKAEAVGDLIGAQGKLAMKAAFGAREGTLGRKAQALCKQCVDLAAHILAVIDYPEEDLAELTPKEMQVQLEQIKSQLDSLLESFALSQVVREGAKVALIGKPNVGKSTLMNLLCDTHTSIVTDIPGTTRDVVSEYIHIAGVQVKLLDTAGIRESSERIEQLGIERSIDAARQADCTLLLFDGSEPLDDEDKKIIELLKDNPSVVALINKTDLGLSGDTLEEIQTLFPSVLMISAKQGTGASEARDKISQVLGVANFDPYAPTLANQRQKNCVSTAAQAAGQALLAMRTGVTMDAVSVELDEVIDALLQLTGGRASQAVTDAIFAQFCVGK